METVNYEMLPVVAYKFAESTQFSESFIVINKINEVIVL